MIEHLEPPLLDVRAATLTSPHTYEIRSDAIRFENWEQNFAGKAALGVAIDYALAWGIDATWARVTALADYLRAALADIDGITVTDEGVQQCGIVTFQAAQMSASDIAAQLAQHHINVHVSSGSSNFVHFQQRGIDELVRASVHYYNTEEEIASFKQTLDRIISP